MSLENNVRRKAGQALYRLGLEAPFSSTKRVRAIEAPEEETERVVPNPSTPEREVRNYPRSGKIVWKYPEHEARINPELIKYLEAFVAQSGFGLYISSSIRKGSITTSGNASRHQRGDAVDVGGIYMNKKLKSYGSDRTTWYRLGDMMADFLQQNGFVLNRESGNKKAVLWKTMTGGNHYNHLHISVSSQ